MHTFSAVNSPFQSYICPRVLTCCISLSFSSMCFFFFFTSLETSTPYIIYVCIQFPSVWRLSYQFFFLLLISSLDPLWLEDPLSMISLLRRSLRFVPWRRVWFTLVCPPWTLGKNVYSAVVGTKCSVSDNQLCLSDGVEFFYFLADFLSRSSVNC